MQSPELVIQSGLEDWQVNFIKGLVSNLLTYLSSENSVRGPNSNIQSGSPNRQVFTVMEVQITPCRIGSHPNENIGYPWEKRIYPLACQSKDFKIEEPNG